MTAFFFVAAAALATVARATITFGQGPPAIPWRTFWVNICGSFLLGLMLGAGWHDRIILSAAALGSFTTFSTVAAEVAGLLDDGRNGRAVAYLGVTVAAGIAAAWFGLDLGDTV